jgi:hypothetical protein
MSGVKTLPRRAVKWGRLGLHHAEHSEKTPDLILLCRILFMGGYPA